MTLRTALVLATLSFVPALSHTQSGGAVHYSVAPVMAGDSLARLAVELRFAGDEDGETRLHLPTAWAGSDSLWWQLEGIEVDGAASVREDGPDARIIAHPPGAPLAVRYRVASAYAGDPEFGYRKAEPIILPGWFFFHGEGVFAEPEGREHAPATFAWRDVPAGWTVASDLDHLATGAGTLVDVIESAAIGGPDLTLIHREVGGAPLRVAVRGRWPFTAEAFADWAASVIAADLELWDAEGKPFFVPLAPLGGSGDSYSYQGTARTDAFSVASTPNLDLAGATRFLSHEYMHRWFSGELGGAPERDEALGFWFSEGFTDFYAARALLRAGLWTPAEYAAELNRVLMRYAASPARTAPAAQVMERFWTDPAFQQLPYDQGHLLALVIDHRVRVQSGGRNDLDDVLRAQRALAAANAEAGRREPAPVLFPALLRTLIGGAAPDLAAHVERGEPVVLPADLFSGCAEVRTITQPDFHRGFDLAATEAAGGVLVGVDSTSPAYAAGLRDGMRIIRREAGSPGDSGVGYVYRVDDGGTERLIRYLPQGKGSVTFQRVILAPDASAAACARSMSGALNELATAVTPGR